MLSVSGAAPELTAILSRRKFSTTCTVSPNKSVNNLLWDRPTQCRPQSYPSWPRTSKLVNWACSEQ